MIESQIIETSRGVVEYCLVGNGPLVMVQHGGMGGYDQALIWGENLRQAGFSILAWSRPGYLRTPLTSGTSIVDQADLDGRTFEPFFQPVPLLNSPIPTIHSDAFSVLF
jgi:hypothetical protein